MTAMIATFTIESVDTSAVGKPPNVEFTMASCRTFFTAEPEGALIVVSCLHEGRSRVRLTDTVRGFVSADVEVVHSPIPGHPEWEDPAMYAGEVACALYWSQWRMQQARKVVSP